MKAVICDVGAINSTNFICVSSDLRQCGRLTDAWLAKQDECSSLRQYGRVCETPWLDESRLPHDGYVIDEEPVLVLWRIIAQAGSGGANLAHSFRHDIEEAHIRTIDPMR